MRTFVSYARKDRDFVSKLCREFINNNIAYWHDEAEITAGNILTPKIKDAIEESTHFILIMSKSYFESEWCLRELDYVLNKQKEENREIIIPILVENCDIDDRIKDIRFIDACLGFEEAWETILKEVTRFSNHKFGRKYDSNYIIDFGLDWGVKKERPGELEKYYLEIDAVSIDKNRDYSVITKIVFEGNEAATNKYKQYIHRKIDYLMKDIIIEMMSEQVLGTPNQFKMLLDDGFAKRQKFGIRDRNNDINFEGLLYCRRMGPDPGNDIIFNYGNIFIGIKESCISSL